MILCIFYFNQNSQEGLSGGEIKKLIETTNYVPPSNIYDVLSQLKRKKMIISQKSGKISFYKISNKGVTSFEENNQAQVVFTEKKLNFSELIDKIKDKNEKDYFEEAISCYEIKAYRACIIMVWITVIHHLYNQIVVSGFTNLQNAIKKHFGNKKVYKSVNNYKKLSKIQDTELFLLLEEMNVIDSNLRRCLDRQLQIRNSCAHPNPFVIKRRMVDAYIEELVINILFL